MKTYNSFEDIEKDLKRLSLERDIAWEELKLRKNELVEDIQPPKWINSVLWAAGKYSFFMLFKRYIK